MFLQFCPSVFKHFCPPCLFNHWQSPGTQSLLLRGRLGSAWHWSHEVWRADSETTISGWLNLSVGAQLWMFLLKVLVATIRWIVFFPLLIGGCVHEMQVYLYICWSNFQMVLFRQCCGEVGKLQDKWTFLFPVLVTITSDTVSMWNKTPRSVFWRAFLGKHVYIANLDYFVQSDPKLLVLFRGTFGSFSTVPSRSIAWSLWSMVGRVKTGRVKPFLSVASQCSTCVGVSPTFCSWDHANVGWHPCQNYWGLMSPRDTCMCSWVRLGLPKGSRQDSNANRVNQEHIH